MPVPKNAAAPGHGKPRLLIVGGVAGGASAAARARRLSESAEIIMYEKGPYVSFANCGLPYYVGDVIKEESKLLVSSPEVFRNRFNIKVHSCAEVTAVDPKARTITVKYSDGREVEEPYDKLILSPGARAIKPPIPGIDLPGIFTLRTIPDSRKVKEWIEERSAKSAVVVGGGFIGMEMAENLVELGLKVTLVEGASQIIPPMDGDMVVPMQQAAEAAGVKVALNQMVQSFRADGGSDSIMVQTSTGNEHEGDIVILGMGVKPRTELAQSANLKIGKKGGITVDEHMRTSDPNIYAAGDAVETVDYVTGEVVVLPLAGPANRQGRISADNALMDFFEAEAADGGGAAITRPEWVGRPHPRFRGVQGTAVCGAFGVVTATTGASEKTLQRLGIDYDVVKLHPVQHVSYYPGAKPIHIKLVFAKSDGRVLGAQAVGAEGAERRIDVFAAAIQAKQTVYDLEEMELCYSPQFGAAKDPVNMAGMIASNHLRGDSPVVDWETELELVKEGANRESLLVDVREPGEFANESIPGAVNFPLSQLRDRVLELAATADGRRVHVHCGVGLRAYYAARVMRMNGIDAYNLTGGMTSYKHAKAAYDN